MFITKTIILMCINWPVPLVHLVVRKQEHCPEATYPYTRL